MANNVGPDQTPRSAASEQDLHRLLMPICPNTKGKYVIISIIFKIEVLYMWVKYKLYSVRTVKPRSAYLCITQENGPYISRPRPPKIR